MEENLGWWPHIQYAVRYLPIEGCAGETQADINGLKMIHGIMDMDKPAREKDISEKAARVVQEN